MSTALNAYVKRLEQYRIASDNTQAEAEYSEYLAKASQGDKRALSRLVSLFENKSIKARQQRHALHHQLKALGFTSRARIIGFTGAPGAGKSTLINALNQKLLQQYPQLRIAVLAVDPSSEHSGGSLLGDRTRMSMSGNEPRLFFRSQASQLELGGVSLNTFNVTRLLQSFFDFIFIETVGIGQNETEVQKLCDHTALVMQPLAGDQIQFMKCGIMEVPDFFVINKCDEESLANRSYHWLRSSLRQWSGVTSKLTMPDSKKSGSGKQPSNKTQETIYRCSAVKQRGIDGLAERIAGLERIQNHPRSRFYLTRWFESEFGRLGKEWLDQTKIGDVLKHHEATSFEHQQWALLSAYTSDLGVPKPAL